VFIGVVAVLHGGHAVWQRLVSLPSIAEQLAGDSGQVATLIAARAAGGRAFSTFALPGHLGALLAALAPLLAVAASRSRGLGRVVAVLGLLGVVSGLVASAAIGALLALVAVTVAAVVVQGVGRRRFLIMGAVVTALLAVVVATRAGDLIDVASHENPAVTRLRLWARGVEVVARAPIFGVGLGSYPVVWLRHATPSDVPAQHAHMSYLEVAAELGLPALFLFGIGVVAVVSRSRDRAALAGAAVLLLHAAIDFDLQAAGLLVATFFLLGLSAGSGPSRPGLGRAIGVAIALAGVALAVDRATAPDLPVSTTAVRWLDVRAIAAAADRAAADGRTADAIVLIERARRLEPETAWLAAREAMLRARRGEHLGAYLALRAAQRLFPAKTDYRDMASSVAAQLAEELGPHEGDP